MPARKPAKKSTKKAGKSKAAAPQTGAVPPYGEAIRGAIARGDAQEMKNVAANARKWITDAQSALKELDSALKPKKK